MSIVWLCWSRLAPGGLPSSVLRHHHRAPPSPPLTHGTHHCACSSCSSSSFMKSLKQSTTINDSRPNVPRRQSQCVRARGSITTISKATEVTGCISVFHITKTLLKSPAAVVKLASSKEAKTLHGVPEQRGRAQCGAVV